MATGTSESAFAFHEPSAATILNLAGFLVALNLVNVCLDKLLYCGLIGQLFIGILWGTPGAQWLPRETETVIQELGYLGLIMLIYEGGLSTSIKSVRSNLLLSVCVALTGIGAPMGLSFILKDLVSASSLQSFAAGAALSATSLGTTFTILSTTDLIATRLGTVTTSAAMLDDVVGLVMVQIISNLGGDVTSVTAVTIVRPIFVSVGFAVGLFLLCAFFKPFLKKVLPLKKNKMLGFTGTTQFAFLAHTTILVGLVAGATYAGTSSLFAAYLAGVVVSWFDGLVAESDQTGASSSCEDANHPPRDASKSRNTARSPVTPSTGSASSNTEPSVPQNPQHKEMPTGKRVYEKYYKQPVDRILIPLFFASIGFAIPITEMFQANVVWRGIIYAILMALGKMITGLWLVRFSPTNSVSSFISTAKEPFSQVWLFCAHPVTQSTSKEKEKCNASDVQHPQDPKGEEKTTDHAIRHTDTHTQEPGETPCEHEDPSALSSHIPPANPTSSLSLPPKPKSLYPPSILGLAMVARGEVGYLIASLARSQGMFSSGSQGSSELYLVVIWAISLCTLVGPVCVGLLVGRVKKLQRSREGNGMDPLGVWGI